MYSSESAEIAKTLSPSSSLPPGRLLERADARVATTMWDLAIWTYQRQRAHRDSGRVGGIGHGSTSATGAVLDRLRLGCSIQGGGGMSRTYCDDDALTVHEMVLRLRSAERALVIRTAVLGREPDWAPRIPTYRAVPVKGRKGKHKGIYDAHGNLIGHELAYEGFSPRRAASEISNAREIYRTWYTALAVLRDALSALGELQRWVVVSVGAEPSPWAA